MKKIFSGIQPSGNLHIGNYIGAIKQWVELQNDNDCIFCIVDLHAITVPQDPKVLRETILEVTALYLACGINPQKAKIFIQSENPHHAELAWILNCTTQMGELFRMTQFKDKWEKEYRKSVGKVAGEPLSALEEARVMFTGLVGLFDYPVLMAADILLYQTEEVPVGEDQKQHIELTRDLAEKFNSKFDAIFTIPEPRIIKETARIMSLQDPLKKMSKSDNDPNGTINILDSYDQIRDKVRRAETDSGSEVRYGDDKPAISNLLNIYCVVSGESPIQAEQTFRGKGYGEFKRDLAEAIISFLNPIHDRYYELIGNEAELNRILDEGRDEAIKRSSIVLQKAKNAVGLGR